VDAVILVVKTGKTHRDVVKRALEHLRESGARFLGIVLNDSKEVLPYYYQYKYYKNYYRKIA
jgi:Mrp family chromosome partitioning ATPase